MKGTERMTILVELGFRFSAFEAHFHRFSILSFSFFFKERVTLIGWMRVVPRLRLLEIREICRTRENWLAKRQAKERNESTFQSIMFHLDSPGTRMCKDLSLSVAFSLRPIQPIPSLQTLLIGMTRQTWIFKGLFRGIYFFFFRKWSLPRITSKTFNAASF